MMTAYARTAAFPEGQIRLTTGNLAGLPERHDALVNAANRSLLGGGGVDGALHRAAGPELLAASRLLGGCEVGEAKSTPAFGLDADHVVYTVAPRWQGGAGGEDALLDAAYASALREAARLGARTVAFPLLGTGAYGYPLGRACAVAALAVSRELLRAPDTQVTFVAFSDEDADVIRAALTVVCED